MNNFFRHFDGVHGGGGDASGISGTLSTGIHALNRDGLQVGPSDNAHGGGGAGFHSGEHGIGYGKVKYLAEAVGPVNMALMQGIKRAFDPKGILNPHKVFEP